MRLPKIPLYLQIIIGMIAGLLWGVVVSKTGVGQQFTTFYIKPFGTIFIGLLKMIALPLVVVSLVVGIANLDDVKKLSRIGGKTIGIYLLSTVVALTIGLVVVNVLQPGKSITEETRSQLLSAYGDEKITIDVSETTPGDDSSPLKPLVDIIPENIINSASDNGNMLQVVFIAVFFGVALVNINPDKKKPVLAFFEGANEAILKSIDYIMMMAPIGVFALIAALFTEMENPNILKALLAYSLTVMAGLLLLGFVVYPVVLAMFAKVNPVHFYKSIGPAQLLAFSTSSSAATLPVTMRQCETKLGVKEEISSFVLPLGATINMDGTSLYQSVATVFIAQVLGKDLSLAQQLTIVITALLASIGTAGVPGAGIVMLSIVLQSVGIPVAYIALIMAPDRLLDMFRTVVNVTGDATVASLVASSEGQQVAADKEGGTL